MGSASDRGTDVVHRELGDGTEEVLSGVEGVVLLRIGEAEEGTPSGLDQGEREREFRLKRVCATSFDIHG